MVALALRSAVTAAARWRAEGTTISTSKMARREMLSQQQNTYHFDGEEFVFMSLLLTLSSFRSSFIFLRFEVLLGLGGLRLELSIRFLAEGFIVIFDLFGGASEAAPPCGAPSPCQPPLEQGPSWTGTPDRAHNPASALPTDWLGAEACEDEARARCSNALRRSCSFVSCCPRRSYRNKHKHNSDRAGSAWRATID